MTMANDIWEEAKPLGLQHFRALTPALAATPQAKALADLLPQRMANVLATANPLRASCTLVSSSIVPAVIHDREDTLFRFQAKGAQLRLRMVAERDLGAMLSELTLGGAGIETGEEESARPVTKLERRLKAMMLRQFAEAAASLVGETFGLSMECDTNFQSAVSKWPQPLRFLEYRLLINAFSFGCDLTVQLLANDLEQLIRSNSRVGSEGLTAGEAMGGCSLTLNARLPPREVPLTDVIALKPGSVLALPLHPAAHLILTCGSIPVFEAQHRRMHGRFELTLQPFAHNLETSGYINTMTDREIPA
jgi:hypothetical protein